MPRVLLLIPTSTYRTEAFLSAAAKMEVDVTVASEQPNALARLNPAALLTLSFAEPALAAQQAVEFSSDYPVDAVVAVDDQVTYVGATICLALGLRHNTVAAVQAAGDKYQMRQLFQIAGLPTPQFQQFEFDTDLRTICRDINFPCVVKPLQFSGSKGVIRANNQSELVDAIDRLRQIVESEAESWPENSTSQRSGRQSQESSTFLVEEFVAGPEIALEGILHRGQLHVLALFDKPDAMDGPFFEETIYLTPSRLSVVDQQQIADCTQAAVAALGLTEGAIHAEVRLSASGPIMIEVNPRSIGGQCSRSLHFIDNVSLEEIIIRQALDCDYRPPLADIRPSGVMMIPVPAAGTLLEVRGVQRAEAVAGIEAVNISSRVGQKLIPLPEGSVYLGFLFARAPTLDAVELALRESHNQLEFLIDPELD
jgi:biotin carboxylase